MSVLMHIRLLIHSKHLHICRSSEGDVSQCPPELLTPIAIAEHLLDETLLPVAQAQDVDLTEGQKSSTTPEDSVESADTVCGHLQVI